jgi:hypothetical protein
MGIFRFLATLFLAMFLTMSGAAQDRNAVMVRGNAWQTGIPGFGSNSFSALSGEYRLDYPLGTVFSGSEKVVEAEKTTKALNEDSEKAVFSVWISGEPLFFSQSLWQERPLLRGSGITQAAQRVSEGAFLIGFLFSGGDEIGSWTVLFQFPRGIGAAGLNEADANRLITAWISRFRYFLSLIKTSSDISLPAIVKF